MKHELLTMITAAAPFAEADAAIPLGISFGFTPLKAYLLAVIGNCVPLIPLLWFWGRGVSFLSQHSPRLKSLFEKIFAHTRATHAKRIEATGLVAIGVLLALPIPFAGAWTATVLAFVFGFPFWKSFYTIVAGVAVGALVVLGITLGFVHFF